VSGRLAPGVLAAVERDLRKLLLEVRGSAEAAAAKELAGLMDQGVTVAACSKELRQVMAVLRTADAELRRASQAADSAEPGKAEQARRDPGIADLTARIEAARRGTAAG
jgi:hypothetical protein